ncbi:MULTISPECIES: 2-succinylbenzoate--CoA ligase [unclassified Leptolyngbya]|uniref:2-succinylbenzoate--CoA ligase n=1 Tax=unclassified Leptolyngbya TaxID=2650499 RepID=UPI001686ABCE|nr:MULTISPECIES: 2-succinylbenzoate--CoA ligase [unclassified Leptolyngbya]MBD1909497.1 2-succinylbenzoate--CoA ligase [Leptolyngbya sp. FACHB-8]MBD2159018.1 2-succinylbenzoate--CoA ligase [Leptolyngbya sp. FACHB-16]
MASPLLQHALDRDWLIGLDPNHFRTQFHKRLVELTALPTSSSILLAEADSAAFLASFLATVAAHHTAILGNPHWSPREWEQALDLTRPTHTLTDTSVPALPHPLAPLLLPTPHILIPTGGTSGQIRFATHTWSTLGASVWGFQQFFECSPIHSCCVLPLYHVSGLMQVLRSLLTQGTLAIHPFKSLEAGVLPTFDPAGFFLSLVPTQLQRLIQRPETISWLQQFGTILLGGAPPWPALLEQAHHHGLRLAPTYGMTETASQVATQKPDDFLLHKSGYQILPHAQITLESGIVHIQAKSLALGYFPKSFKNGEAFKTDDVGCIDEVGRLHLRGRASDKIITGGENVFPAEVEAAIRATGLVEDVAVIGVGDRHWGEAITAIYVPAPSTVTPTQILASLAPHLSRFKHPKHWIPVLTLPRTPQGKLNRAALEAIAQRHIEGKQESQLSK